MKAIWRDVVLAESDKTIVLEGNHYFPPESVRKEYLKESNTHSECPWKGRACYYDIEVDGQLNRDAAWYYPEPKEAARDVRGYIAFWKGVQLVR